MSSSQQEKYSMVTQVVKWGNSQGIRIPKAVMEEMDLHINDLFDICIRDGQIILEKTFRHKSLEERAEPYGGVLGPYDSFDWGEPKGREIW